MAHTAHYRKPVARPLNTQSVIVHHDLALELAAEVREALPTHAAASRPARSYLRACLRCGRVQRSGLQTPEGFCKARKACDLERRLSKADK